MKYIFKALGLLNTVLLNKLLLSLVLFSTVLISACTSPEPAEKKPAPIVTKSPKPTIIQCTNPRPEICTRDYRPVCATRDSGIRCVTIPCPSTESATYPNGCSACADPKVFHHQPGKCEQASPTNQD
jgi:hypothetical protein